MTARIVPLAMSFALGCGGEESGGGEARLLLTSGFARGALGIAGTVTLPMALPASQRAVLAITRGARPPAVGFASEFATGSIPAGAQQIAYAVGRLDAAAYTVFVGVDLNRDTRIGPGDLGGYYDGTVEAPIVDPKAARLLELTASTMGVDFGLGPVR